MQDYFYRLHQDALYAPQVHHLNQLFSPAEILVLQDVDYEDGMLRPKLTYEYNDEINIYAGADIFYGSEDGLFGQFNVTDRVVSGVVVGF